MEDVLLVRMEGIEKSFPGVHALAQARFELRAGEVHALVGENGAGKSSLMKVLAGVQQPDAGQIFVNGKLADIRSPRAAQLLGISMIHQELNLMNHLTVAQNIYIGREPRGVLGVTLNQRALNQQTEALLDRLHLKLDPRVKAGELTVAKQQMVEIAKALSYNAKVLIMDEPTAALTDTEIEDLFGIVRHLREQGVGVVHISHRLEELKTIADRITVMRDGQYVDTVNTADVTLDQIIKMMVGRVIYEAAPEIPDDPGQEAMLEVRHLNRGRTIKNVSFSLKQGEILGFSGLVGAGRTEVARAIFGADRLDSGEIFIKGKRVQISTPHDAVQYGLAYLSEDRKRFGLALGMDVETNVVLASFRKYLRLLGWVNAGQTRKTAQQYVELLSIRTPGVQRKAKNLSGGNQQKVVVGKWLAANADILIFDEPTRGIDVGAKSEIYRLLNDLARQGKAIIMISSELPEILRMSHRIIVMCEGRITGELSSSEVTQEKIMQYATQRTAQVETDTAWSAAPEFGKA